MFIWHIFLLPQSIHVCGLVLQDVSCSASNTEGTTWPNTEPCSWAVKRCSSRGGNGASGEFSGLLSHPYVHWLMLALCPLVCTPMSSGLCTYVHWLAPLCPLACAPVLVLHLCPLACTPVSIGLHPYVHRTTGLHPDLCPLAFVSLYALQSYLSRPFTASMYREHYDTYVCMYYIYHIHINIHICNISI